MFLVTGSTGYIGSHLVRRLLACDMKVRGLVLPREASRARALADSGMEVWLGDLRLPATLRGIARKVTVAFHLAGTHSHVTQDVHSVYVDGTRNLIRECRATDGIRRLIVASNASIYDDGGDRWLTEDDRARSIRHPFGRITEAMEDLAFSEYRENAFPVVILRIADVYGPGTYNAVAAARERRIRLVGDGNNWTSHIHIRDLINVFGRASELTVGGAYNVSDDAPVRSREFYTSASLLASAPPPEWTPWEQVPYRVWSSVHGLRAFSLRLSNSRLKSELKLALDYPTHAEGLASLLSHMPQ